MAAKKEKRTRQKQKQRQKQTQNVVVNIQGEPKRARRRRAQKRPQPDVALIDYLQPRQMPTVVYQTGYGTYPIIQGQQPPAPPSQPKPFYMEPPQPTIVDMTADFSRMRVPVLEDTGMVGTEGFVEILERPTKREQLAEFITPVKKPKVPTVEEPMQSVDMEPIPFYKLPRIDVERPFFTVPGLSELRLQTPEKPIFSEIREPSLKSLLETPAEQPTMMTPPMGVTESPEELPVVRRGKKRVIATNPEIQRIRETVTPAALEEQRMKLKPPTVEGNVVTVGETQAEDWGIESSQIMSWSPTVPFVPFSFESAGREPSALVGFPEDPESWEKVAQNMAETEAENVIQQAAKPRPSKYPNWGTKPYYIIKIMENTGRQYNMKALENMSRDELKKLYEDVKA